MLGTVGFSEIAGRFGGAPGTAGWAGGPLRVECRCEEGRLRLAVADEGRGLPAGFDAARSKGLGMTIVGAVVRQLGGVLSADNDGGARFTLDIPAPRAVGSGSRSFAPPGR